MKKTSLTLADISAVDRIIDSKTPRNLISKLRRFQEISKKTRIKDAEEDDDSSIIDKLERKVTYLTQLECHAVIHQGFSEM